MGCFYQPVFGKHLNKQDLLSDHFTIVFRAETYSYSKLIFISDLLVDMDMLKNVMFVIVVVTIGRWTHSISATWMCVLLQHSICLSSLSLDY